ncbi:MAG: metallophosphoesterase family protein, partial [Deltaproteobacteria bacterium]|nr:metallophosphoesterase family protein [Deltaproteobacteria bacterium]
MKLKRETSFLNILAVLVLVFLACSACTEEPTPPAVQPDLPVIVPEYPLRKGTIRNPVTIAKLRHITSEPGKDKGLIIDLGDKSMEGITLTSPYPFESGIADYPVIQYQNREILTGGRGLLQIKETAPKKSSMYHRLPGVFPPATKSIAFRLYLLRPQVTRDEQFGYYDGLVNYRLTKETFVKNLSLVEGPQIIVTSDSPTQANIIWETDLPSLGQVFLARVISPSPKTTPQSGPAVKVGNVDYQVDTVVSFSEASQLSRHQLAIGGLQPGSEYIYVVQGDTPNGERIVSEPYLFKAAPQPGQGSVIFSFISDTRAGDERGERDYMGHNSAVLSRLTEDAYRRGAELMLAGGNLVKGFTSDIEDFRLQLKGWKQSVAGFWRSRPVFTAMGNHEALSNVYDDGSPHGIHMDKWPYNEQSAEAVFADEFCNPVNGPQPSDPRRPTYKKNAYHFQYGPVLFICVNNNYWWTTDQAISTYGGSPQGYIFEDQLVWFENVLTQAKANATIRYIVVYCQQVVFPCGGHMQDGMWWNGN